MSHGIETIKAQPIVGKVTEKVSQLREEVNTEKVKGMFNTAFTKVSKQN